MGDEIPPELQKWLASMKTAIDRLDAETKSNDRESRQKQAANDADLKLATEKEEELAALTATVDQRQAETAALDAPLEGFLALENFYKQKSEGEQRKLNAVKEERKRLEAEINTNGGGEAHDLFEDMTLKLADLNASSRNSQMENACQEKRDLDASLANVQIAVKQEREAVQALKNQWREAGLCTTTAEERNATTKLVNELYKGTKDGYIASKLDLHRMKLKVDE